LKEEGSTLSDRQNKVLTSIVSYPERGKGGSNRYRGNCSPELIKDLVRHFDVREICDFMCGSGTTKDAADALGFQSSIYDLHSGFDLLSHDIKERPEYIFFHPPYHDIITYSDSMYSAAEVQNRYGYDPRKTDLSRIPDWESFVKALNFCVMKQFCALEKGGRMAVLVGDIKKRGKLYSMIFELIKPGTMENVIIKAQHNCFSDNTRYSGSFIPIVHEYLLLLRKDAPLLYSALLTRRTESDIRDMPGATWRDIVADAMEEFRGAVELPRIYASIEGYKRAREQQHWKEKVRQTLQYHPDIFCSPQRGVWVLAKYAA
jgi:hypothetical protein